jgi:sortase A
LQPIPSTQAKIWQFFSCALILGGLVLLGMAGWMFYQYQLEGSKPPPARILEVKVPEAVETALPRATVVPPTALASAGDTIRLNSTTAEAAGSSPAEELIGPYTPSPAVTPVNVSTPSALENMAAPEPAAESPASQAESSAPVSGEAVQATASEAEGLSLADNPLIVDEQTLTPVAEVNPLPLITPATSPPTRIVAESIGLDTPVVEVGWTSVMENGVGTNVWIVADYAAGWHQNSALPGQGGNVVLSGHHNIKGEVFRYTIDMNIGDIITLYVGDQPYRYAVVDKFIVKDKGEPEAVRRENARWIGPFNEERLTLVTCWPYTNNTHRAMVIAKPVEAVQ